MSDDARQSHEAVTTPVGAATICPQCGVVLDALTTTCGACGAVITAGGPDSSRAERVRSKLQDAIGDAFVLGELLGRGGMGIVFRAREKALDRDVALKVLAFDPILNPEAYARFEREAKLAAKLDHPNIVPIFSVGQRNGVAFYTMRMVKGGSVEQMITPGRGLDVAHALNILRDVASALDYAHANGVVHRDIKPANILIGDSGHALVADFGIARAFGGDAAGATTTATGTGVVGSPAYMSPEQWRGEKVDGRADQYALGVLGFELLSGKRPFADASMQELLRMHLAEDPPDIISFRQDLPSHVTDAIWRAMAKEPGERHPTAMAFVHALEGDARAATASRAPLGPAASAPAAAKATTPLPGLARAATTPPAPRTVRTGTRSGAPAGAIRPAPPPAVPAASHRSTWLVAALLLLVGGLGGVIFVERGRLRSQAALPAAANADSLAAAQRAQAEENQRLQREVEDAKRIALAAEHKLEQLAAAQAAAKGAKPPPAEELHAHLFVMAQGGTPAVFVDGAPLAVRAPAVIEVKPGRHIVSVAGGGTEFFPADYSIELVAGDTQQVVFMSRQLAQRRAQQQRLFQLQQQRGGGAGGAGGGAARAAGGSGGAAQPPPQPGTHPGTQLATPPQPASPGGARTGNPPEAPTTPGATRGRGALDPSAMTPEQRQRFQEALKKKMEDAQKRLRKKP